MIMPPPTVRFFSVVRGATLPMTADLSALGSMPFAAYQYCEALRTASAFGWYVFPLDDVILRWDGADVYTFRDGEWEDLDTIALDGEAYAHWKQHAPDGIEPPPVVSPLFVPGVVQLWSGLMVTTAQDWSLHVRPIANVQRSHAYAPYEGIIETDEFRPCPLFINIRLIETNRDIVLEKAKPLFQAQPLPRAAYRGERKASVTAVEDMTAAEWEGIAHTIRVPGERPPGAYAAAVRRRAKRGE